MAPQVFTRELSPNMSKDVRDKKGEEPRHLEELPFGPRKKLQLGTGK